MTSDELAGRFKDFIGKCAARILTVGKSQYDFDGVQKFEGMPILELLEMAREEAQDLAVYAAMLDIRFARLEAKLREAGIQ